MIVVDTSVLIAYLSGHNTVEARFLKNLEQENNPYAITSIALQEVLQGAKDEKSWKLLKSYLTNQIILSPLDTVKTYEEAAHIYFDLRKKGITVRSSNDCLIAQIVMEHGGILLHKDVNFVKIKRVRDLDVAGF